MSRRTARQRAHGQPVLRAGRAASWLIQAAALLALLAWAMGRVLSDRYAWSQFLLWIPTPAATVAAVAGLLAVALLPQRQRARRPWRTGLWGAVAAATIVIFAGVEHRILGAAPGRSASASEGEGGRDVHGLRLVNWNAQLLEEEAFEQRAEALLRQRGDVIVVTSAGATPYTASVQEGMGPGYRTTRIQPFAVITRVPIRRFETLIATGDGIRVALLELDTREALGRPLTMHLVDLPSDPRRPRFDIARRVRRMLDEREAPRPDIVMGDFNITRGSAAMARMYPGLTHAYEQAGHGYAASFHRRLPLYHIDHILLDDHWVAAAYELVDTGVGRHHLQWATVQPVSGTGE